MFTKIKSNSPCLTIILSSCTRTYGVINLVMITMFMLNKIYLNLIFSFNLKEIVLVHFIVSFGSCITAVKCDQLLITSSIVQYSGSLTNTHCIFFFTLQFFFVTLLPSISDYNSWCTSQGMVAC
jgi:hypothetical protein